jgi:hypothetical protein
MALRLLRASGLRRPADATFAPMLGAGFAALLFAIHPLRAGSVAWITERRDVLSGLFYLAAVVAYLRYCDPPFERSAERAARGSGTGHHSGSLSWPCSRRRWP